jgi:hypothetical protein
MLIKRCINFWIFNEDNYFLKNYQWKTFVYYVLFKLLYF